MAATPISLVIDPGTSTALDLTAAPFNLLSFSTPTPALDPRWAQPADADGDRLVAARYLNRELPITLEIWPSSPAAAQAALAALAEKVAKVNREGAELGYTLPTGETIYFDLLTADPLDPPRDLDWDLAGIERLAVKFTAKPFARLDEIAIVEDGRGGYTWGPPGLAVGIAEPALPALVVTVPAPPGDVPGLGRVVVTDTAGADQAWFVWGQHAAPVASSTNALFYEAEDLTPLGTAVVATLPGASGGAVANVVNEDQLLANWAAVVSTRLRSGPGLTHIGGYRVYARIYRPQTNAGACSIALEWSTNGFVAPRRNEVSVYGQGDLEDSFLIADLGVVDIPAGSTGWEGRVIAKSTAPGDDISVDWLLLVPTEQFGVATVARPLAAPTAFLARDEFDQAAGTLSGKTAPVGGVWGGSGSRTDFSVASHVLRRTAVSDPDQLQGRLAILGSTDFTDLAVAVDSSTSLLTGIVDGFDGALGVVARYVDASNFLVAYWHPATTHRRIDVVKVIGGTPAVLQIARPAMPLSPSLMYRVTLAVSASGMWAAWWGVADSPQQRVVASGYDPDLAPAGTLSRGRPGIVDSWLFPNACTRTYDNFAVWVPVLDVAIGSSMSAQIAWNGVTRQDPETTQWGTPGSYEGALMRTPPAGASGRSIRFAVKASRAAPGSGADSGIDGLSAKFYCQPQVLIVSP